MENQDRIFSQVSVETNTRCNLRCRTCPNKDHERPFAELSTPVFTRVLTELSRLGFAGLFAPHFYNEPLMDVRIIELLRLARMHLPQARIRLFSNFTLMTPETYRSLFALVNEFVVTVDEPVIKKAVEDLAARLTPYERTKILARSLEQVGVSNRAGMVEVAHERMHRPDKCPFALRHVDIDAYGDVHLCCNDYESKAVLGNVNSTSLQDIWYGDAYRDLRRGFARGEFPHSICKDCLWVFSSRGDTAT
jgi:2-deoxy-scyllo-inosamine dehydrogenase (SAM-dependent)